VYSRQRLLPTSSGLGDFVMGFRSIAEHAENHSMDAENPQSIHHFLRIGSDPGSVYGRMYGEAAAQFEQFFDSRP
jgi:hypothetical protein